MPDESHLDLKYFIDSEVYNCPYCNRRNVVYHLVTFFSFDWSNTKTCHVYKVICSSCDKQSIHLSFTDLQPDRAFSRYVFKYDGDLDSEIFYSVPTSFFTMDDRIPHVIRELIAEADGCLKMNFLTGASACARKAIYELLVFEKVAEADYESRIKSLKQKYPDSDAGLFDILASIQGMTSDKVHEQSWPKWDSGNLRLILETLKTVLQDIYVAPKVKRERAELIAQMRQALVESKKGNAKKD